MNIFKIELFHHAIPKKSDWSIIYSLSLENDNGDKFVVGNNEVWSDF